jgi:nucleoside-diphosphate-sugar epimerase
MKIFLTGATGLIGGSIGATLAQQGATVMGLVRNSAKAEAVRHFGMTPVIGDLDDTNLLQREAKAADTVVNAASSDHRGAVDALVSALAGSGKPLVHTSGSSIVSDEANGEYSDRVFDENSLPTPEPDKQARVALDAAVLAAPGAKGIVLCNTMVYGDALGPKAHSVQLPRLIDEAVESGTAHYIGRGLNVWSTVAISDLVSLYLLAVREFPAGTFAFVENGEYAFRDLAQAIATAYGLNGPESMSIEDAVAKWGREAAVFALGSNSRVRGKRARELGWKPVSNSPLPWITASGERQKKA